VRIASANCGSAWSQTFSFDPFGNITKSGSISWACATCYDTTKNRYNSTLSPSINYDNNGNLTNDTFHTYTWDAEGKSFSIDTVDLTYDALGRMVEQNRSGAYTEIVYAPGGAKLALMTGQTLQKAFVPLPGGGTAVFSSSGLAYYRHPDWLGSSRVASTPSRALYYDAAYAPYGESYATSGTTDPDFTGQNQDTVSGTVDFLLREYNANQGRWISPDPAGAGAVDASNPQTWNRYAYVGNNPLRSIDLLGLEDCLDCLDDDGGGGGGGDGGGGGGGSDGGTWGDQAGDNPPSPLNLPVGPPPNLFEGDQPAVPVYTGPGYTPQSINVTAPAPPGVYLPLIPTIGIPNVLGPGLPNGSAFATARAGVNVVLSRQNDCSAWLNGAASKMSGGVLRPVNDIFNATAIQPYFGSPNNMAATLSGNIPAPIYVNVNGAFFPGQGGSAPIGGAYPPGSTPGQIVILLHEVAHKVNAIPRDSTAPDQSVKNSVTVVDHCGAAINGD
jgi:RHS repeat-associated protein